MPSNLFLSNYSLAYDGSQCCPCYYILYLVTPGIKECYWCLNLDFCFQQSYSILLLILIVWRLVLIIKSKNRLQIFTAVLNYKFYNDIVVHNYTKFPEHNVVQRALTLDSGYVPRDTKMKIGSGAPVLDGHQIWPQIPFLQNFMVDAAFQTVELCCQTVQVPMLSHMNDLGRYLCLRFL